jgi:hypothetical protein
MNRPSLSRFTGFRSLVLAAAVFASACGDEPAVSDPALDSAWREMIAAEEMLAALTPARVTLARSVANLKLPDETARGLFAEQVDVAEPSPAPGAWISLANWPEVRSARHLSKTGPNPRARRDLELWRHWLSQCRIVDHAKFAAVSGRFEDADRTRFAMKLSFHANCSLHEGGIVELSAPVTVGWQRDAEDLPTLTSSWRIASWRNDELVESKTRRPVFAESLERFIADSDDLASARESVHQGLIEEYLADPQAFAKPHDHFWFAAHDRHPAVAVADVDGNGYDDIYLMARWGRNRLYLAGEDGRFEERAAEFGLDIKDHCSAALFADFDNDGDLDAVIGRTLLPSRYLRNEEGRFVDRTEQLWEKRPPSLVASLSASDFDKDGLLDLHVATYAARMIVKEKEAAKTPILRRFLSEDQAQQLTAALFEADAHEYLALPGPPNRLYRNAGGGRFEAADAALPQLWRNSYQATWADYDADGDSDLYVANDFSLNNLFRNDGGVFVDVTEETGTADIGFGMGISWGDYDADGREDFYVSNMFSKAGTRIMEALSPAGRDPRFAKMARGNTLFRNEGDRFEVVSRPGGPAAAVEIAGWSWGGQFVDFNNDGLLDLYVPNGYYSAPPAYATPVDI